MHRKFHVENKSGNYLSPEKDQKRKQLDKYKCESLCLTITLTAIKILPMG